MMSESELACSCIVDTHGLLEIAKQTSGNVQKTLLNQISTGVIGVPALVWREFKDLYPEEAAALYPSVSATVTIAMRKRAYTAKAGSIAEKLGTGFPSGPYDRCIEIQVAAIGEIEKCPVLTSINHIDSYKKMSCEAIDIDFWLK